MGFVNDVKDAFRKIKGDALDDAIRDRESRDIPRWGGFAQQEWVQRVRHQNQRARLENAPTIGEIVAMRFDVVCNTGDLIAFVECADGRKYELRMSGCAPRKRLPVDHVYGSDRAMDDPPSRPGVFHASRFWISEPRPSGDTSPTVYQPNHVLRIDTLVETYEDFIAGRIK